MIAGLALLGVAVASAVHSLSEPGAFSLDNLGDSVTVVSLGVGLLLVNSGLISSVTLGAGAECWPSMRGKQSRTRDDSNGMLTCGFLQERVTAPGAISRTDQRPGRVW